MVPAEREAQTVLSELRPPAAQVNARVASNDCHPPLRVVRPGRGRLL